MCGKGRECRKVQDAFREQLKDIRGQTQKIPNAEEEGKTPMAKNRKYFVERLKTHFSKSKLGLEEQNNTKSSKKKTDVYVALWHYDKLVLERLEEDETSVPFFLAFEDLKNIEIYRKRGGKVYSMADICPEIPRRGKLQGKEVVAIIPTCFNINDARLIHETTRFRCCLVGMRYP